MAKPTDIRIVEARIAFEPIPFRMPLKFGGRIVDQSELINVEIIVESESGVHATGIGSMPLGHIWAWPSDVVAPETAAKAMKAFAEEVTELFDRYPDEGHPLDIVFQISAEYHHLGRTIAQRLDVAEPIPHLAQLVAASAVDAALHDAFGRVHGLNSFNCLSEEFVERDLSEYLDDQFEGEFLDQYTLREPKDRLPLYHLVGAADPLTEGDIEKPINDGLPVTLGEWIAADGLTHLKIKLAGDDLDWDVERVVSVERVTAEAQQARGCDDWVYSLDFNEKCENEQYVLDFLGKIKEQSPAAYDRTQYIEQPTHRDLEAHPDQTMHEVAKQKPVVIDEALNDYDSLMLARERGYTGAALKACKGQTETLLVAAAAQKFGMFLCVQDLTCPGYSFLHSAAIAARIPGVTAIEGNARQYCPAPNKTWQRQYPRMFKITDGTVGTEVLNGEGLGF